MIKPIGALIILNLSLNKRISQSYYITFDLICKVIGVVLFKAIPHNSHFFFLMPK